MKEILTAVKRFMKDRFSLDEDKADEALIIESIDRNVHFKGTNLWTLIFAILIASIGLNVNSTAVIIGAMLISPLMGPIMGIGLGIGIIDFDLMKRGIKNLMIAALFSIITSFLYFSLSPLHEARTEILARTTPSIWDVLIAFFGGMAGIIAGTRKEKSNILPGVAIATALMPPLCTAGFGLATGEIYYFLGAIYLFFINSLFICLATFIIVRYLKFQRKEFATPSLHRRMVRYIWTIVFITIIPSIYLAFRIVQKTIFEENARKFVQHEFRFVNTQVVHQAFRFDSHKPSIELLLVGQELDRNRIDTIKQRMPAYHLDSAWLNIHQGLDAEKEIDFAQIKASIMEDVFDRTKLKDTIPEARSKLDQPLPDLRAELYTLYPTVKSYSLTHTEVLSIESGKRDTVTLFAGTFARYFSQTEKDKLQAWLKERVKADSLKLMIQVEAARLKK